MSQQVMTRREFLRLGGLAGGALIITACGGRAAATPTPAPATATPIPPTATSIPSSGETTEERVLVGDVLDYALTSSDWEGAFGFVTFKLHQARYNGDSVYFIRTDCSDAAFSQENGLVHVPLLNVAAGRGMANTLYLLDGERPPVVAAAPGDENYSPLFQIKRVTVSDNALELDSAEAVEQAAADGQATIEEQPIFVNYPVVKWPGGELPVDTDKTTYLGTGQLLEPVDTEGMKVTFKLHQCFPGSRYIVTDTSAAPMAPMMSVSASSPTQQLVELGGTDEIWVFANGLAGSGVMGFQPAIFDNQAGQPAWSPFWDHFTLQWVNESQARLLRSSAEARAALEAGEVEQFNGTPDSHPTGFVVNCPVPILAPNTFTG
ncbi:MAG: hypothetical protein L0332_08935 [Chloroflexi bacterium]|nr:hypothetical protein [Chloroflexota bacterium]MCI0575781.1 hypothetical protein [Chloroflexota bacterium]MCI0643612.1 hypothetical protein [Chloroflexota bacterium]MCI0726830.1 hypothetical protein [Chloroflexota bacterium]